MSGRGTGMKNTSRRSSKPRPFDYEPARRYAKPWLNRNRTDQEEYQYAPNPTSPRRSRSSRPKTKSARKKLPEATSDLALRLTQEKQESALNNPGSIPPTEVKPVVRPQPQPVVRPDDPTGDEDEDGVLIKPPHVIGTKLSIQIKPILQTRKPKYVQTPGRNYPKPWLKYKNETGRSSSRVDPNANHAAVDTITVVPANEGASYASRTLRDSVGNIEIIQIPIGDRTDYKYNNVGGAGFHNSTPEVDPDANFYSPPPPPAFDPVDEGLSFENAVRDVAWSRQNVTFFNYNFEPFESTQVPLRKKTTFGKTFTKTFLTGPGPVNKAARKKVSKKAEARPARAAAAEVTVMEAIPELIDTKVHEAAPKLETRSKTASAPKFLASVPTVTELPKTLTSTSKQTKAVMAVAVANPQHEKSLPDIKVRRSSPRPTVNRSRPNAVAAPIDSNMVTHTRLVAPLNLTGPMPKPKLPRFPLNTPKAPLRNTTRKPSIVAKSRLSLKTSFVSQTKTSIAAKAPSMQKARPARHPRTTPSQSMKRRSRSKSCSLSPHSQFFGRRLIVRSISKRQYPDPDSILQRQATMKPTKSTQPTATTIQPGSITTSTEGSNTDSSPERLGSSRWSGGVTPEMILDDVNKDKPIEFQPRKNRRKVKTRGTDHRSAPGTSMSSSGRTRIRTPVTRSKKLTKTKSKLKAPRSKTKPTSQPKKRTSMKKVASKVTSSHDHNSIPLQSDSEKSIKLLYIGRTTPFDEDDSEEDDSDSSIHEQLEYVEETSFQDDFIPEDLDDTISLHSAMDTESLQTAGLCTVYCMEDGFGHGHQGDEDSYIEEDPDTENEDTQHVSEAREPFGGGGGTQTFSFQVESLDTIARDQNKSSESNSEEESPLPLPNTESFTVVSNEHGQKVGVYADGTTVLVNDTLVYPSARNSIIYRAGMRHQQSRSQERRPKTPVITLLPPPSAFTALPRTPMSRPRDRSMSRERSSPNRVMFVPNILDYPGISPLSFEPPDTAEKLNSQTHWDYLDGGTGAHHQPLPPPPTFQERLEESEIHRQLNFQNRCWTNMSEIPDLLAVPNVRTIPRRVFRTPVLSYDLPTYDEFRTSRFRLATRGSTYPPNTPPPFQESFYPQQHHHQPPPSRRLPYGFRYPERHMVDLELEEDAKPRTRGHPPPPARPNYDTFPNLQPDALNPPIGAPELRNQSLHPEPKLSNPSPNNPNPSRQFMERSYQETQPDPFTYPYPHQMQQEPFLYNVQTYNDSFQFQLPCVFRNGYGGYESSMFYHEPYNYSSPQSLFVRGQQIQETFNAEPFHYADPIPTPEEPPVSHYPGLMKEISETNEVMEDLIFFNPSRSSRRSSRPTTTGDSTSVLDSSDLMSFDKSDDDRPTTVVPLRAKKSVSVPDTASTCRDDECKREKFSAVLEALAPMNKRVSRETLPTIYSTQYIPPPAQSPASPDSSNASIEVLVSRDNSAKKKITFNTCPCYACRKAAGFRLTESQSVINFRDINYVKKNIKDMKNYVKPAPTVGRHVVDHPKGDRVPPMVFYAGRKGFGKVPKYIQKRKQILEDESRLRELELQKLAEEQEKERKRQEHIRRQERRAEIQRKKAIEARIAQHRKNLRILTKMDENNNIPIPTHPPPIPTKRDYAETNIFIGPYHPSVDYLDRELGVSHSQVTTNFLVTDDGISNIVLEEPAAALPSCTLLPNDSVSSGSSDTRRVSDILEWIRKNSEESMEGMRRAEMTDDEIFFNLEPSYLLRRGTSSAPGRVIPPVINPRLAHQHFYNHPTRLCRLPGIGILGIQMIQSTPEAHLTNSNDSDNS